MLDRTHLFVAYSSGKTLDENERVALSSQVYQSSQRASSHGDRPPVRFANVIFLISQPFVTRGKVDDAAIGEAVLLDVVLHDAVVFVGVNANVHIMGEAEVHDVVEDTMDIRVAGDAMDDMIGHYIVQPLTIVYL